MKLAILVLLVGYAVAQNGYGPPAPPEVMPTDAPATEPPTEPPPEEVPTDYAPTELPDARAGAAPAEEEAAPAEEAPAECADTHPTGHCQFWAWLGECTENSLWMTDNCCESCGKDFVGQGADYRAMLVEQGQGGTIAPDAVEPFPGDTVSSDDCCAWANAGECDSNPFWMRVVCTEACGTADCEFASALDCAVTVSESCADAEGRSGAPPADEVAAATEPPAEEEATEAAAPDTPEPPPAPDAAPIPVPDLPIGPPAPPPVEASGYKKRKHRRHH